MESKWTDANEHIIHIKPTPLTCDCLHAADSSALWGGLACFAPERRERISRTDSLADKARETRRTWMVMWCVVFWESSTGRSRDSSMRIRFVEPIEPWVKLVVEPVKYSYALALRLFLRLPRIIFDWCLPISSDCRSSSRFSSSHCCILKKLVSA